MAETHSIMPKSLAKALMDAGVQHFDLGGSLGVSNTYNSNAPGIMTQKNLPSLLAGQQGNAMDIYGQQQGLANTLLQQSQGQGPNVAQNQLNQATGNNVANQGALMAGQRGAGANVGLMARQAAQQGAATQQQAVGQAATLGAQQQLAAQGALQQQQSNMSNQNLQNQSINQGALAAQNSALTTGQLGSQQINAGVASGNTAANAGMVGGLLGAGGSVLASQLNKGGMVQKFADGGQVNDNLGIANFATPGVPGGGTNATGGSSTSSPVGKGLGSFLGNGGQYLLGGGSEGISTLGTATPWETGGGLAGGAGDAISGVGDFFGAMGTTFGGAATGIGGEALGGAGNIAAGAGAAAAAPETATAVGGLAEGATMAAAHGGKIPFSTHLLNGGNVPGKANVKGDSPKNDTQPTLLSPGEEVLPRSITMAKDAPEKAKEFVAHLQAKQGKSKGYGGVASAKKSLEERVKHLEMLCGGGRA